MTTLVTLSLSYDQNFSTEPNNSVMAIFYGLGLDETVGANKNSVKIIGGGKLIIMLKDTLFMIQKSLVL